MDSQVWRIWSLWQDQIMAVDQLVADGKNKINYPTALEAYCGPQPFKCSPLSLNSAKRVSRPVLNWSMASIPEPSSGQAVMATWVRLGEPGVTLPPGPWAG